MSESITIKGISQGILATLANENDWLHLESELVDLIDQQGAFFKGGQLVIDVKQREISAKELSDLQEQLAIRDVRLVGVLSEQAQTRSAAEELELAIDLAEVTPPASNAYPEDDYEPASFDSEEYGTAGVLVKRTLRSGRTVRSAGHVVVIGDVNSGAEIVAVGDIIVWGKIRGTVHAGAQGDESAVVCALDLKPLQLRIAGLITIPPKDKRKKTRPEMAKVSNGQIEAIPWPQ